MKILSKYFTTEFFKLLFLCQTVFISLYLIIDFLQKIDNFIEAHVSASVVLAYFLYKVPLVVVQMLPVATLISVIIMFSLFKKKRELTAVKACGLNIYRLVQPIVITSILVGACLFLFSEIVVPYTSAKFNEIWDIEVEKRDSTQFYGMSQIWYKGPGSIYWMRRFDSKSRVMERPTLYFFDKSFHLVKRIDGRRAVWAQGQWRIEEGIVQEKAADGGYRPTKFEDLSVKLEETPQTFERRVKSPEEMSYWQLKRYARRVLMEGYDNTRYLVDMNLKIAFPFIILIMVIVGIPVALKVERGGISFAISIGMCICFLYLVTLGFTRSLGLSGVLPPILSAWLSNLIFLLLGIYLMMKVER